MTSNTQEEASNESEVSNTPQDSSVLSTNLIIDDPIVQIEKLALWYANQQAIDDVSFDVARNKITALIGPSGCGKSTLLRCINRMNDLIPIARIEGQVKIDGEELYGPAVDPVEVRRIVGMVFQKPNPFPKSIYENVAFGARINGYRGDMDELVQNSLQQAALWDEVKDKLID